MHFRRAIRDVLRLGRHGFAALSVLLLSLTFLAHTAGAQSALNTAQSRLNFDHLTTGFELVGQHRDLPCESCHVNAIFKGTPKDCGACHGVGTLVRATAKPKNHILSTDQCGACHTPVAWNPAFIVDHTQVRGTCSTCHNGTMAQGKGPMHILTDLECDACHTTLTWAGVAATPPNHIPTNATCGQCHTTGDFSQYSRTGTHLAVTTCLRCHGAGAGPFTNITIVGVPGNHIPIGSADCNGSGCHSTANVNPGGFVLGTANPAAPTLSVAGHATIASAGISGCQGCHEAAPYLGMMASSATAAADSRPQAFDKAHPATGDCTGCHTTTPPFASNVTAGKPSNHIPTSAPCVQCHTTVGNYALYDVVATHQGATNCLSCHGATVAGTFSITANPVFSIISIPGNHIPFGTADCNGSGCHSTANVNPGGFKMGTANISSPTLNVAGHTTIATGGVLGCSNCHETALYLGMMAGSNTAAGDSRPSTTLDAKHPTTGDCGNCHVTSPTFAANLLPTAGKPANHIPTSAGCAQCHTTAGNYAVYSVTGTHAGVTGCLSCHGPNTGPFAGPPPSNTMTIVGWPGSSHFPIGTADCNGSGCHSTSNVNPGGFKLAAASLTAPTLNVAGHATIASAGVAGCQTCHETAPYTGMIASSASAWGDSRPQAFDKAHPATGDCNGCHSTSPTFMTNQMGSSAKPSNHIPTNAPCAQCHTTAGNYAAYVMGATGHAGITNNCAQCHAYGLSFYNMAAPTLKQPAAGATGHIPSNPPNGTTTVACELCHSAANFTTFSGTIMRHAYVTSMQCMACHEFGMTWQTNVGVGLWRRPNQGHYKGQDCGGSGCHSARDKFARAVVRPTATAPGKSPTTATTAPKTSATTTARTVTPRRAGIVPATPAAAAAAAAAAMGTFNHATVAGTPCVTCHDGSSATGKPATHIAASNNCQNCHTTIAWLPVKIVDHSQVIGTCVSCHNGQIATGKPSRHVATTAGCERCHTTNAWTPARFDHAAVAAHTCATCHNGVQAIGMPRTHIPTTQSCDVCHGTLAFKPAKVDHSAFVTGCASCHNNVAAVGMPTGHLGTRIDCSTCHSFPNWSVLHFRHVSAAYPGDHRVALSCTSCHSSNTDAIPWRSPANAGSCAGCHAANFKPAAHPKTVKGQYYTVNELANCSGACHVYSDSTQSTITRSLPGPYHRVSDAAFKR